MFSFDSTTPDDLTSDPESSESDTTPQDLSSDTDNPPSDIETSDNFTTSESERVPSDEGSLHTDFEPPDSVDVDMQYYTSDEDSPESSSSSDESQGSDNQGVSAITNSVQLLNTY